MNKVFPTFKQASRHLLLISTRLTEFWMCFYRISSLNNEILMNHTLSFTMGAKEMYKFAFGAKNLHTMVVAVSDIDVARLITCYSKRRLEFLLLASILSKSHQRRPYLVIFTTVYNENTKRAVFDGFVLNGNRYLMLAIQFWRVTD